VHVLLVTKGHPFEREPFLAMWDALEGVTYDHVEHPEARDRIHPERVAADVIAFYDMPGLTFTRADPPLVLEEPPAELVAGFEALLDVGVPMVFLHHAVAGWPAWERYAEVVGGRFHYAPATLRGVAYPDSGYLLDVTHTVEVLAADHPICAGLPPTFELRDELYCFPVVADDLVPLLRTRHPTTADAFWSADRAIRGRLHDAEGWTHPPGSDLVAWARVERASPIVYLQPGDGPPSYADPNVRRLLANALAWAVEAAPTTAR